MFENFEQMFNYYKRRNIFNENDWYMLATRVISDNDSFLEKIVWPKHYLGRLNYGDVLRIVATIL